MQRPLLHFAPTRHWGNDPNGLIRTSGGYRLFFQYADDAPAYRSVRWGSASSADLLQWSEERAVLAADRAGASCYSGTVLRCGNGDLLAFFTEHEPAQAGRSQRQSIATAVSRDDGCSFAAPRHDLLRHSAPNFRDPFVCRSPAEGYLLLVAQPCDWQAWHGESASSIALYASADLTTWRRVGAIGPWMEPGVLWEMPWLHVLRPGDTASPCLLGVSCVDRRNDRAISAVRVWSGVFKDHEFVRDPGQPLAGSLLDFGPDYYAATVAQLQPDIGSDNPLHLLAWHGSWDTARELPFAGFRGGPMSWPWQLQCSQDADGASLRRWQLPEAMRLQRTKLAMLALEIESAGREQRMSELQLRPGASYAIDVHLELAAADEAWVFFGHAHCALGLCDGGSTLVLQRDPGPATAGIRHFQGRWSQRRANRSRMVDLTAWFDGCLLEALWDQGSLKASAIVDVEPQGGAIELRAANSARVQLTIWQLQAGPL